MKSNITASSSYDKDSHFVFGTTTVLPRVASELASIPATVHLGLTVAFISLFGLLFIFVYLQLFRILRYGHKRISFQTIFLFLCVIWAALRISLFSFYFRNCELANKLPIFFYWLLYCCPVCLQFITLSLLTFYFGQAYIKGRRSSLNLVHSQAYTRNTDTMYRILIGVYVLINVVFVSVNVVCAILIKQVPLEDSPPRYLLLLRVLITELLFVAVAISLCYFLIQMKRAGISAKLQLDDKQEMSMMQAALCSGIIVALYVSRAIYNIIAVNPSRKMPKFGLDWVNVTDQADLYSTLGYGYVSFVCVLLAWEVLPTFCVVWLFRVKRPYSKVTVLNTSCPIQYDTSEYIGKIYDENEDYSDNLTVQHSTFQSYFTDIPNSYGRIVPSEREPIHTGSSTKSSKFYGSAGNE